MFKTKRSLVLENQKQKDEISMLREQIRNMNQAMMGLQGVGHCISNYCLSCKYALISGEGFRSKPYACIKDSVCKDYDPA